MVYRAGMEVQRPQAVNLTNLFLEGKKIKVNKPKWQPINKYAKV